MNEQTDTGIVEIPLREFEIYCLSLPEGLDFGGYSVVGCWADPARKVAGAILADETQPFRFGVLVLRRDQDFRFQPVLNARGYNDPIQVDEAMYAAMKVGYPLEPISPGKKRRRPLFELAGRKPGGHFELITTSPTHISARVAIGEVYLAMPKPDDNFVSDMQTANFSARLWELYLLACFREQGVRVTQDLVSPDFHLTRAGQECFVEAVTANDPEGEIQGLTAPTFAPTDRNERMAGAAAVRFAKTLHSKLQRNYHTLPEVAGKPFAMAIADFHAPSSMVWSSQALPTYLYGDLAKVVGEGDERRAVGERIQTLLGDQAIPAGPFRNPAYSHVSAVVSSNAATIAKFNRMGALAGWRHPKLTMTRSGIFMDRTPGALEPIDFSHDVFSEAYAALWPGGEMWCQELEVFHNPLADHPFSDDLLPGATHWRDEGGEIICRTPWANSVIASTTTQGFAP